MYLLIITQVGKMTWVFDKNKDKKGSIIIFKKMKAPERKQWFNPGKCSCTQERPLILGRVNDHSNETLQTNSWVNRTQRAGIHQHTADWGGRWRHQHEMKQAADSIEARLFPLEKITSWSTDLTGMMFASEEGHKENSGQGPRPQEGKVTSA